MTNAVTKLKLFIEAASMVGGEDWVPNKHQWELIMKKIMELPEAEAPAQIPVAGLPPQYPHNPHPMPMAPHQPGLFGEGVSMPGMPGMPPGVGSMPPSPVPPAPIRDTGAMGGAPSQLPVKLKVNPDGSPAPAFS